MIPQDVLPDPKTYDDVKTNVEILPPWEQSLLQELVLINLEAQIWESLCNTQCFVATDGSAPQQKGSFMWILSNASGDRLARGSGRLFGHAISSYRAEAYGLLSAIRFLYHMVRLHKKARDHPKAPHLVCDNQGLITMITTKLTYSTIYVNTTMEAEWDCIAQILSTPQSMGDFAPTIEHIKGHQDETTPYEELPLLAQLNCDANVHANRYLQEHSTIIHTTAYLFPEGQCVLQLPEGTITRNIKEECVKAWTLPPYREYVTTKSGWWTDKIYNMVDWTAHSQALKQHEKHRTTLVKYIHSILPLGKQVH